MPRARLVFDGDWVYTEKEARIHKLTQETENKIDNIPGVVDDVNSTSTTDALSANMGKRLQDQINQLTWLNKFLSTWDCTTGLPVTDPSATPFTYASGNYYLVATVAWEWGTNYKPHWSTFTPWVASTAVETNEVNVNDMYIFDWSQWILQVNKVKEIIVDDGLSPDSTNAVENRAIYNALTTKQDKILDLADIRAGAALGMTSIQPWDNITELTNNVGYQTAGDVASAINDAIEWSKYVWPTAPDPATEWMLWYDTTNDVLKSYDWTNWNEVGSDAADINTKTFYLSNTGDTTNAKAALDWYLAGKNPIIIYNNTAYIVTPNAYSQTALCFCAASVYAGRDNSKTTNWVLTLAIIYSWDTVTSIQAGTAGIRVLETDRDYSTPYTPEYDWSPTTKKYVDDKVKNAITSWTTAPSNPVVWQLWYDTTNHILKIYNWTSWVPVDTDTTYTAGTNVQISNQNVISSTDTTYTAWTWLSLSWTEFNVNTNDIATVSYVDWKIYIWWSAPGVWSEWMLWFDTSVSSLKVYLWFMPWRKVVATKDDVNNIISDAAFSASWDWDTTHAPSKNAIYDVLGDVETLLANL